MMDARLRQGQISNHRGGTRRATRRLPQRPPCVGSSTVHAMPPAVNRPGLRVVQATARARSLFCRSGLQSASHFPYLTSPHLLVAHRQFVYHSPSPPEPDPPQRSVPGSRYACAHSTREEAEMLMPLLALGLVMVIIVGLARWRRRLEEPELFLHFRCSHCSQKLRSRLDSQGRRILCPQCLRACRIPSRSQASVA